MKDFFIKVQKRKFEFLAFSKSIPIHLILVGTLLILAAFLLFRFLSYQERVQASQAISTMLRNENLSVNAYAISRTLSDLEMLNLVECSQLSELKELREYYYDTSKNPGCYGFRVLQDLFQTTSEIRAINGALFQLRFQLPFRWASFASEILSYVLIIGAFGVYGSTLNRQRFNHELRLKAAALEKAMVVDVAKQVKHDVASPISSLRTILKVLHQIDPEIRSFLERTVQRTEEVFGQLALATQGHKIEIGSVHVGRCLEEIIQEKQILWDNRCAFIYTGSEMANGLVLGNEIEFKRVLSNLLNNAFESLERAQHKEIRVKIERAGPEMVILIEDTGTGIPEALLLSLGKKQISFGKENHLTAGSGLGVFHAYNTIRSWGGDLHFQSRSDNGTQVSLKLNLI